LAAGFPRATSMEVFVGLRDEVRGIDGGIGLAHTTLGVLKDAHLADRRDQRRRHLSPRLVSEIREELRKHECLLWPEALPRHRKGQDVYLIAKGGKTDVMLGVLRVKPDPLMADALREFIEGPSERDNS
jgi:hypothetical protein